MREYPEIDYVIPLFGDGGRTEEWSDRAVVAAASVAAAGGDPIIHYAKTLAEARNDGAAQSDREFLCFVDADDEVSLGFHDEMRAAIWDHPDFDAWQPSVAYYNETWDTATTAACIPYRPLTTGNYLIISTVIKRRDFERVGGFKEWPIYEDWDLFLRIEKMLGKELVAKRVPAACYVAHQKKGDSGRNLQHRALAVRTRREIEQSVRGMRWR